MFLPHLLISCVCLNQIVPYRAFSVSNCRISSLTFEKFKVFMPVYWFLICKLFFQEDFGSRTMFLVLLFGTLWCFVCHTLPSHTKTGTVCMFA
jgi:hypothetical protein